MVGIVENDLYNEYVSDKGKEAIATAIAGISDGSIEVSSALNKEQDEIQSEIQDMLGQ